MKNIFTYISIVFITISASSFKYYPSDKGSIIGLWWSPKKDAKIEICQRGDKFFGKFVWLATPKKDEKNPNKNLQSRDIVGLEFLTGFKYDEGNYTGGDIYDPESGKTYSCKMSLNGTTLKVRGYIGISLFGRTEYFEKIK